MLEMYNTPGMLGTVSSTAIPTGKLQGFPSRNGIIQIILQDH